MINNLKQKLFKIYSIFVYFLTIPILLKESKFPIFKEINERAIEYGFVFKHLCRICPTEVLDVGTGKTALPHLMANCGFKVKAIDKVHGYWSGDFVNRHFYIRNDDITSPKIRQKFDFITCISVLEHIPNHRAAVKGMFSLLKTKGHLVLTFPYNEKKYLDNVYKLADAGYGRTVPYICQVFQNVFLDGYSVLAYDLTDRGKSIVNTYLAIKIVLLNIFLSNYIYSKVRLLKNKIL